MLTTRLQDTTLPWNGSPAKSTGNLWPYFAERLGTSRANWLPRSIRIFADTEIEDRAVERLITEMAGHFESELEIRKTRRDRFVELGVFDQDEIDGFLTQRCHLQPWVIYYSKDGGLRTPVVDPNVRDALFGVVPCATMQNHGVAWRRGEADGTYDLWLVTARKEGQDWDLDSDIGHESAHAAFAQIPLYIQPDEKTAGAADLINVNRANELSDFQRARMCYMYMETAVVAMRGERRENETGLPLADEAEELHAFLKLSAELMPQLGFDRALAAFYRANGSLDFNSGSEIFEIAAPAMRVVPHISRRLNSLEVPKCEWFQSLNPASRQLSLNAPEPLPSVSDIAIDGLRSLR